jgi:hypothetical protein
VSHDKNDWFGENEKAELRRTVEQRMLDKMANPSPRAEQVSSFLAGAFLVCFVVFVCALLIRLTLAMIGVWPL